MLVHNFLQKSAERLPHKEALICNDRRLTFSEIEIYSNCLGNALKTAGLKKLDRVAIYLENSVETVISIFGILKAGGIFTIINPQTKAKRLEYILNDCQVKVLITDINLISNYSGVYPHLSLILTTVDKPDLENQIFGNLIKTSNYWEIINQSANICLDSPCSYTDLSSIIYTSGSTSNPKGVMLTHSNMVSAANSIIEYLENTSDDIIVNVLPLSFDYGLYNVLMPFYFGGTVVLEKSFISPHQLIGLVKKEKVTGLPIVPTIITLMLNFKNLEKYDFSSIRYITNTGQALPLKHIFRLTKLFPQAKIYSMYGLTECKRVSYLPPDELLRRPNSVGKAMPNVEVYLVREDGSKINNSGEIGELIVQGANVMKGYLNLPEETAKVLKQGFHTDEKVLHTGDLFKMDEDMYLYFIGRKDDLIKTSGERVSPKEVENILYELKGINEIAVYGVEDEILGQAIKVSLVLEKDSTLTKKDILEYCSIHLEKFMMPKYVEIVDELPKTINGKINKKLLKQLK
ncbi:class I adenylate-forming enzyme family protein [Nostoc commune]|uniref:class I adenylate-forming enzyme family protein n=1 Tax=Nostoc commune TaxID=1178 RepID=UPI0018C472BE|nr:AMP-binding protein [Nostoc commune]MBG1259147.1 AMP-binding protein [Nostoc commune BAE]